MTKAEFQAQQERSALRKRRLATQIDDAKLIAAIRFYLAVLLPTRRVEVAPVRERCKDLSRKWKAHLKAARRILGIEYKDGSTMLRLPAKYWQRLQEIGLEILDSFGSSAEFYRLNANLVIDDALTTYAAFHPVLKEAKGFLCGGDWPPKPEPPKLDPSSQLLENSVKSFLHDLRSRW
jgi:hypothetical protein